jgi:hypothetical protein
VEVAGSDIKQEGSARMPAPGPAGRTEAALQSSQAFTLVGH